MLTSNLSSRGLSVRLRDLGRGVKLFERGNRELGGNFDGECLDILTEFNAMRERSRLPLQETRSERFTTDAAGSDMQNTESSVKLGAGNGRRLGRLPPSYSICYLAMLHQCTLSPPRRQRLASPLPRSRAGLSEIASSLESPHDPTMKGSGPRFLCSVPSHAPHAASGVSTTRGYHGAKQLPQPPQNKSWRKQYNMSRLLRLGGAVLLLATSATAQTNANFEVDIVFPRNETYTPSDAFPLALAIQNMTAVRTLGDWIINWGIMVLREGRINKGGVRDSGIMIPDDTVDMGGYALLMDYTDMTEWIKIQKPGDAYELQWNLDWPEVSDKCGWYGSPVGGRIQFSIEVPGEEERSGEGIEPDVAGSGKCPVLSTVAEIRPNPANETCPDILNDEENGIEGTPCKVVVDDEVAEKVTSEVERQVGPTEVPWEDYPEEGDEEDAAGSLNPAAGATFAAACALGYIAFACW